LHQDGIATAHAEFEEAQGALVGTQKQIVIREPPAASISAVF